MKRLLVLAALSAGLLLGGCFRPDIQTWTFRVPQMSGPACAQKIQAGLARTEGVTAVQPDLAARTVAITFDHRVIASKNIEFMIAELGFDIEMLGCSSMNTTVSNPSVTRGNAAARAALPAGCR